MKNWHDFIKQWGGPRKFARDIGVTIAAGEKMSTRNNVHSDYWPVIVARAPQAGLDGITYELLASLKRGRASVARFRSAEATA